MTVYLLLRNNKQSGPYSLEDLKNMGLKAYDLVWLEGRSAAWRYPSEIDELKEFAPAVEEQPFDRFYKKPGAAATAVSANGNMDTTAVAFQPTAVASATGETLPMTGKRIIYVTLPAGRPVATPMRDSSMRDTPMREAPMRETPVREVPRETNREAERPRIVASEPSIPVSSAPAIADYASLSDHRHTSTVEISPRLRHPRNHSNERIVRIAGIGLCILALLAAGIFIGLSLNKNSLGLQKQIATRSTPTITTKPVSAVVQDPGNVAANSAVPATSNSASPANTAERSSVPATDHAQPPRIDDKANGTTEAASSGSAAGKRTRKQKEKDRIASALMPPVQKDSALAEMPVVTREAVHRTVAAPSPTDSRETAKTAIANEVSVGANRYSVGTFGGINDLQVTVTNRSAHPLDLVVVEVQYIQANKKVYKTENLNFHDVGPGGALMQEAPRSSRGIRVQYRIVSISSKELGLSYSGL